MTRQDSDWDPEDLSFIAKIAAIGDSYSAGIGAGTRLGSIIEALNPGSDYACSRYDHAYPSIVNGDERLGDPANRNFQFQSCSGAVTTDVIGKQIPNIDNAQQVILLSAGGNDVELTNILNQCVYQWGVVNREQVAVAKFAAKTKQFTWAESFDWDALSLGCEGQLARTQTLIDSAEFSQKLDLVLSAAKLKLAPGGMIYYTGYAKFWAEDLTADCNRVSWSTWLYKAYNVFQPEQKLTQDHRRRMNELVGAVNAKLSAAAEKAGTNVKFVDYDAYVGKFHGRCCEAGVDESTTESNSRSGLMFYELNTQDPLGSSPWKRSTDGVLDGTVEASQSQLAQITLLMDPDAQLAESGPDTSISESKLVMKVKTTAIAFPKVLPDGYGRVFHPQILLHQLIAQLIIHNMIDHNLQTGGLPSVPEVMTLDSCPYTPNSPDMGGAAGQQIAVASYTNPLGDPVAWQRLIAYDSSKLSVLVANVLNGPDYVVDKSWSAVIQQAAATGKTVIGYVRTGYLGVSQQKFKTRLGSSDLADWASQIEQDVDKWFELYPGSIGGIFFDEGWPECGPNNIYSDLYAHINAYTKRKHPGAYTVLNPGSPMAQCFEDTMDTLLTFESSYETYTSSYVPNDWTPKDDRKIWHIIYRVPQDKIGEVAELARSRHAGYVEMTDDDNPNPYDNVPVDSYMQTAMAAVSGGRVHVNPAKQADGSYVAGIPGDAAVIASDYTSVTITWSPVANALGYAVYQNGGLVLEMPATLTRATVGMLQPGSSGLSFEVRTVLSSSSGGGSRTVSASTKSLPGGESITNVNFKRNGDTVVYTADVLVPYAFVRLFIGGPHKAVGAAGGWPIDAGLNADTGMGQWKLASYLVEGNDFYSGFYKYSGSYIEAGSSNADWTWTPHGTAPQSQSGYTYTWNVPLGGTDAIPDDYAVQGQGYAPIQNIFGGALRSYKCDGQPCDDNPDYDCKGSTLCWTPALLKWCDEAVNNLTRTDALTYATFGGRQTGNCHNNGASSACGVFIQGDNCEISGNDLWHDYQNIRSLGGCQRCGSFKRDDGCKVKIDYVSNCDINTGGTPFKSKAAGSDNNS